MTRLLILVVALISLSLPVSAQQRVTVKPDATVSFRVSNSGITRISVSGDRITDLVSNSIGDDTLQVKFDERTGDAFLRFTDPRAAREDSGFLVTQDGVTLNYVMKPGQASSESVLISVNKPASSPSEPEIAFATNASGGGAGGYSGRLVTCIRQIFASHVDGQAVPRVKHGALVRTIRQDGCRARLRVARAGKTGGAVRPQDFHRAGKTIAVFVDKAMLAPGERSFVVELVGG